MDSKYHGPYTLIKILGKNNAILEKPEGKLKFKITNPIFFYRKVMSVINTQPPKGKIYPATLHPKGEINNLRFAKGQLLNQNTH